MRARSVIRRFVHRPGGLKPPACPPGWRTGPPDFVGVGAQRAGTTWWYGLIESHPTVDGHDRVKELHFLSRYWNREFTDADRAQYERFFPRADGHISGEWSPGYMSHFWVPALIARAAPSTRLLVRLRDPIERYRSGLVLQSETAPLRFSGASTAFRLGLYASQLEQLFQYFPREQILVLQHELCTSDARGQLARTYEFLGVDPTYVPPDIDVRRNEGTASKPELPSHVLDSLRAAYAPEVARLQELVPDLDLSLWSTVTGGS